MNLFEGTKTWGNNIEGFDSNRVSLVEDYNFLEIEPHYWKGKDSPQLELKKNCFF